MIEAYILIQVRSGTAHQVAEQLSGLDGVAEAHVVMGPYDVIAFVRVCDTEAMHDLTIGRMHTLPGISRTLTCSVVPSQAPSHRPSHIDR